MEFFKKFQEKNAKSLGNMMKDFTLSESFLSYSEISDMTSEQGPIGSTHLFVYAGLKQ